jgi:hypothetical protein
MMKVVAVVLLLVISACSPAATPGSSPTAPSTGSPPTVGSGTPDPTSAGGADGLVDDLVAGGATARLGSNFFAEPIPGEGVLVCLGTEAVQVYVLRDHEAALAAASSIDTNDPSKIGASIVDWAGRPRFWLRDRILILYVGSDAATDAALRTLLGRPFAEARLPGRPPLPAPDCA